MKETRERQTAKPATGESEQLHRRAQAVFPGGVNSPVRAFRGVGGVPRMIASAKGAWMTDEDGNRLLDYVLGWGPLLLGHAHPVVVRAVEEQLRRGALYGASTRVECELAELVRSFYPAAERLRFVSTGTEATMSALRVARAATKRPVVLKLDGCYHGHADPFLIRAGSGAATLGIPDSPGVPESAAADTRVAAFNDLASVRASFEREPDRIAAVIVEPVVGNHGVVAPTDDFLPGLRALCDRYGSVLIFDEVMSGFRAAPGGAAERYGVRPDLVTLGKVIGGGLPAAAFGGRSDLMALVAPEGPVYQAGTYSGNPLSMAAGLATLRLLRAEPEHFRRAEARTDLLAAALRGLLQRRSLAGTVNALGSMWTLYFGVSRVGTVEDARRADRERYARFFHGMLERGVYLPPSPFESAFLSSAHADEDVDATLEAADEVMEGMAR